MIAIKKNTLIVASMIVLLVMAGVLNYYLTRPDDGLVTVEGGSLASASPKPTATGGTVTTSTDTSVNSIAVFKENRTKTREEEITYLDSIIENDKTDAATIKAAQQEKLNLVRYMEAEVKIEGLLAAKGFKEVVATVSDTSVNVVVVCDSLSDTQVAQILDIIRSETDVDINGIKIIPVRS